jgi:hypothetical protein
MAFQEATHRQEQGLVRRVVTEGVDGISRTGRMKSTAGQGPEKRVKEG